MVLGSMTCEKEKALRRSKVINAATIHAVKTTYQRCKLRVSGGKVKSMVSLSTDKVRRFRTWFTRMVFVALILTLQAKSQRKRCPRFQNLARSDIDYVFKT